MLHDLVFVLHITDSKIAANATSNYYYADFEGLVIILTL